MRIAHNLVIQITLEGTRNCQLFEGNEILNIFFCNFGVINYVESRFDQRIRSDYCLEICEENYLDDQKRGFF